MPWTRSPTPSCFYCTNPIAATRITKRGKGQALHLSRLLIPPMPPPHHIRTLFYVLMIGQEETRAGAFSTCPCIFHHCSGLPHCLGQRLSPVPCRVCPPNPAAHQSSRSHSAPRRERRRAFSLSYIYFTPVTLLIAEKARNKCHPVSAGVSVRTRAARLGP